MEYLKIAGLPLEASCVALGTWAIGGWMWGGTEESDAISTIHAALGNGIHLIHTAPVYGFGRSEELVGKALEGGRREGAIIATKVGLDWESGKDLAQDSTPARLRQELEDLLPSASRPMWIEHLSGPLAGRVHVSLSRRLQGRSTPFAAKGKFARLASAISSPAQMDRFRNGASLTTHPASLQSVRA